MALIVFGLAQVGVHLVFFLHLTTSPDNTNNALALAFGVLFVCFVFFGTIWVMYHMDQNLIPAGALMRMRGG
jgi:cytochrome o ubiquinol oxidase operon protein cyoD